MKIKIHTPTGKTEKILTNEELIAWAKDGNMEAARELTKEALKTAVTADQKIDVIIKYIKRDF